jgi:hypothetical protein
MTTEDCGPGRSIKAFAGHSRSGTGPRGLPGINVFSRDCNRLDGVARLQRMAIIGVVPCGSVADGLVRKPFALFNAS